MPTVPDFANDPEKIAWLRQWFASKGDFDATVAAWDTSVQRYDSAVTYAGYIGATTVTLLSTAQSLLTTDTANNASIISILSYVQTAVGAGLLLIGTASKIGKENHITPRDKARAAFDAAFFNTNAPGTIWTNPHQDPQLESGCMRCLYL